MSFTAVFRREALGLVQLAVPLVAGLTVSSLLLLTDTWLLGPLGETSLASASLAASVSVILWSALYGFLAPVGVLVARAWGAGDYRKVAAVVAHGRWLGLAIGTGSAAVMGVMLLALPAMGQPAEVVDGIGPYWIAMSLVLVPYSVNLVFKQLLDAVGQAWTGVALMSLAVLVNVPLNYALIHGAWGLPRLGLAGAGAATVVAEAVALAAFWIHWRRSPAMAPLRQAVRLHPRRFSLQTREGIPMGVQYLAEGSALAVAGVLIGLLGATALAANQIVFSIASVLYMLPLGMAGAVAIRIGQALGAGEGARVRGIGLTALALVTSWTVLFMLALVLGGERIAALFVDEHRVVALAAAMFLAVGAMQVFDGIQSVSLGALRALLDTRWATGVSLAAYWLLALPLGWLLAMPLGLGAAGFWAGFTAGLAIAALMLLGRFLRQSRALAAAASV